MKNKSGYFRSFWALAVSFLVVVSPIYLHYDNLSEVDFFSPTPAFELLDPEDMLADEKNQVILFAPSLTAASSLFCFRLTRQSFEFVPLDFSVALFISPLRC